MNSKQTKIIFTGIIILFLIFIFIYTKSFEEFFFNEIQNLTVEISRKNNILLLGDNTKVIDNGNLIHPSKELVVSNQTINKNFKFNGFIFKISDFSNFQIGFKSKDHKELDYYFDILENQLLSIVQNNEKNNIDFCSIQSIKKCNLKKNTYSYTLDDYLGIQFTEDNIIYFSIKKNQNDKFIGNIIHKSLKKPIYPLNLCILNYKNDILIKELYWTNNKYSSDPNKWSLEILQNTEDEELPPQETLTIEEEKENKNEEIFKLDKEKPWIKKIFIIEQYLNRDSNILSLTCITNMSEIEMKYIINIYINIIIKIDGRERILNIPHNKYIITGDSEYENKLIFKLNISNYQNYFNYDLSCKVELVRSKSIQNKNIISNIVKL